MPKNIELRRKVNGSFDHEDSVLYPQTLPENLIGFLDNGKIDETYLPGSVFGGMRFVNNLSTDKETGYVDDTESTLGAMVTDYLNNNGGEAIGLYFIASQEVEITASTSRVFEVSEDGADKITLKANDWLVVKGVGPSDEYLFARVNNTYNTVDSNRAGLMTSTQYIKLDGISEEANKYIHDTFTSRSTDTNGVEVLDTFESNSEGHVTTITTRSLPDATSAEKGVTQLATGAELKSDLSSSKVVSSLSARNMIDYFTGNHLYSNVSSADDADHKDGAIVFVDIN